MLCVRDFHAWRVTASVGVVSRSHIHQEIGYARTVDQHVSDAQRKANIERKKKELVAERLRECTFKPKTTATPESVRRYREEEGGGAHRFNLDLREHPERVTHAIAEYQHVC
mgnify:CR=1 FL=1